MSTVHPMSHPDVPSQWRFAASPAASSVHTFSTGPLSVAFEEAENGVRSYEAMKVFKSGTFKDSMGYQATWEKEHLAQMVFNFNMLKERKIFENVPVRDGHPGFFGSGGRVIGYVTDLEVVDENGESFLAAKFEITEPDDAAKIDRGTFRARSAEIGFFESNDEALYWPVFQGFAFVDIGAVQGLFEKAKTSTPSGDADFAILFEKEKHVDPKTQTAPVEEEQKVETPPVAQHSAPPVAPPAAPEAPTTPAVPAVQAFRVNGQETSDFAAVQSHINALETTIKTLGEQARKDFVASLVGDRKVPANQSDDLEKLALSMNDEQFSMFRTTYSGAPAMTLLANHSAGHDGGTQTSAEDEAVATQIEIVNQFKRAGRPDEWIKNTKQYKSLEAAGKAPNL